MNAVRRPGPGGSGGEEAKDLMTPLHLCCSWGLEDTVQALIEHGAKVNAKVRDSCGAYGSILLIMSLLVVICSGAEKSLVFIHVLFGFVSFLCVSLIDLVFLKIM